jgi:hypothetical protein
MTDPEWNEARRLAAEGLVRVGEVTTRVMREAIAEPDFREAMKASEVKAYAACAAFATEQVALAGPYDDTRALRVMLTWLSDRVREVQTPSYDGAPNATT